MPPGNGFGKSGVADFNAIKAGTFVAIETKFGNRKPTPMQLGYLSSIDAEGGLAFLVNEKNLDWLKAWLEAFDRAMAATMQGKKTADTDMIEMLNAVDQMTFQPEGTEK